MPTATSPDSSNRCNIAVPPSFLQVSLIADCTYAWRGGESSAAAVGTLRCGEDRPTCCHQRSHSRPAELESSIDSVPRLWSQPPCFIAHLQIVHALGGGQGPRAARAIALGIEPLGARHG